MGIFRWILWLFFGAILFVVVFCAAVYISTPKQYHFLVIGSDQRGEERARSDVLMVLTLSKKNNGPVSLITIPRDTLIEDTQYGMQKITHFYAFGERTDSDIFGNTDLTKQKVEELLDVKIAGTFEVTFEGFKNIVDELGGVDTSQGHLNGEQALEIVRDRYREGGDLARAEDQREILLSLTNKLKGYDSLRHIYAYVQLSTFSRIRWSKYDFAQFVFAHGLSRLVRFNFSYPHVEEIVLPGTGQYIYTPEFGKELYYWVLDEVGLKGIQEKYLR